MVFFLSNKGNYNKGGISAEEQPVADLQRNFPPAKKFTVLKVDKVLSTREFLVSDKSNSFTLILSPDGHLDFLVDKDKKNFLEVGDLVSISADYVVTDGAVLTVDTIIVPPSDTGLSINN